MAVIVKGMENCVSHFIDERKRRPKEIQGMLTSFVAVPQLEQGLFV